MPRETLDRDQIVRAAIELLDADGIEGLSMRRIGRKLGSAATTAYWHIQSKQHLLALAADVVWAELELPDPSELGWRAAARQLSSATYALYARHPWLMPAITTHFVYCAGMARHQDHNYAVFEAAGFSGLDLDWAVSTISTFVSGIAFNKAFTTTMEARIRRGGEEEMQRFMTAGSEAKEIAGRFPRLLERMTDQRTLSPDESALRSLEFGLETILDGLEERLRSAK